MFRIRMRYTHLRACPRGSWDICVKRVETELHIRCKEDFGKIKSGLLHLLMLEKLALSIWK